MQHDAKILIGDHYGQLNTFNAINVESFKESTIIVYIIYLTDYIDILNGLTTFLDPQEKEKAFKYFKEIDRNRFIISRGLLKFALAYHTQSDISHIAIEGLPNKKPYLPTHPNVFFNVSHSGDYAVFAISTTPVGIDIEYMNLNYPYQETLPFIFNEADMRFINNAEHTAKTFYSLWTRKEAFVKALGKGIDDDFSKIPCRDGLHSIDHSLNKNSHSWLVHGFQIAEEYLGAIAYSSKESIVKKPVCLSLPKNMEALLKLYS